MTIESATALQQARAFKANDGTKLRIAGPFLINGMSVWRLYRIGRGGLPDKQVGPDCFSFDQVMARAKDVLSGRKVVWVGQRSFEAREIKSEREVAAEGNSRKG